ncbi:MAG: glycosyltransferase family 2 protein [Chthoniobacterales bacterium]|nr:glycosyltransferase family 2 protein [Chthoniobacterales bacterium]
MISITIPIYNERESITPLFKKICEVMDHLGKPYEVIFINDGSSDGGAVLLNEIAAHYPQAKVIHFRRNFGQTAAMMAGFDYASGDVIIPMDGDYQNDPEDIPRMLAKLEEGYDVCSGWRRDRQDNALQRNIPSVMANKLISAISGVRLHDFGCSLKAYRRDVIEGVRLYGEMHRFLPIYTKWYGARITELPVNHFARRAGKSKYGLERVLKVILDLMVVKFLDRHAQKPMYVFGASGLISLAASFGFVCWAVGLFFFAHKPLITTPLPLMAVFTFLMGVMSFLMGLLAEMIMRTFYESQGKSVYLVKETKNMTLAPAARNLPASTL